ncbi:hypothetical protein LAV72_05725 [Lysinibacillus xylanilyticus]|uniref:hypothetical protein n=1 Tax=Lysinibacillus xylanilyticus TaxID=582475 RepID=UPI002B24C272|nr:hypothetical protein [Lysinibacillus xylanilyticus]MEB2299122.1 hypothetical protein [Lysinibacillus xylanilyticus]
MNNFFHSGAILLFIIGLMAMTGSCFYSKKEHEKFRKYSTSVSTGNFLGDILGVIVVGLLSIFPWYINKIIMLFLGVLFFYFTYLAYIGY